MKQFSTRRPDTRRRVNRLYCVRVTPDGVLPALYTNVLTWSRKQAQKIVEKVYNRPDNTTIQPISGVQDHGKAGNGRKARTLTLRSRAVSGRASKRYRRLRYDERLRKGDEYKHPYTGRWLKTQQWRNNITVSELFYVYRRPIGGKGKA